MIFCFAARAESWMWTCILASRPNTRAVCARSSTRYPPARRTLPGAETHFAVDAILRSFSPRWDGGGLEVLQFGARDHYSSPHQTWDRDSTRRVSKGLGLLARTT